MGASRQMRAEDRALWDAAVAAFQGRALADIEDALGVKKASARAIRLGEVPLYLHEHTRAALASAAHRGIIGAASPPHPAVPTPPLPSKPGVTYGGRATGTTGASFADESERRGYLRRALEDAQRRLADAARDVAIAQAALDAPIAGAVREAALVAPADAVEAIQDRQAADAATRGRKGA